MIGQEKLKSPATHRLNKCKVMALRVVLISLVVIAAVALSGVSGIVNGLMETAPSIDTINVIPDGYATTILNSKGKTIQTLVGKEANRQYATLDTIPKHLQNAFVAIEDERFWVHDGIDLQEFSVRHSADCPMAENFIRVPVRSHSSF